MKAAGYALIVLGTLLILIAFLFDPGVSVTLEQELSAIRAGVPNMPDSIFNLERAQLREMMLLTGATAVVTGAIFAAAGEVIETLTKSAASTPEVGSVAAADSAAVCGYCGLTVRGEGRPCSAIDPALIVNFDVRSSTCRQNLEERGLI